MELYAAACEAIDRASGEDPKREEPVYSRRMVGWVSKLAPQASEELLLAARAQHLRRWTIPRSKYPADQAGYLSWRQTLKRFHAETLAGIMRAAGYSETSVAKGCALLVQKHLAQDPEGQTLEDAACLVFLEFEFPAFSGKTAPDKMVEILRKSWRKMSPAARARGLELRLEPAELALVQKALETWEDR